ncbi:MAG: VCBS repeat-containing protein [Alphaproteobacteria bacterium]|nr:VCBS repeat-containing protein [Alphaproteobacteria bacterium]MCB9697955.1 VCBS repeat-containing protein [Alphaproteobacteria bacterium]
MIALCWGMAALAADTDGDGVDDAIDVCVLRPDPGQEDGDGDGTGDACDACPGPGNGLERFAAGTLVEPVLYASDLVAIDVDLDGDPDLVTDDGHWYANDGSGGFSARQALAFSTRHVVAGDLDGDGDQDLVFASPGTISVGLLTGPGTFAVTELVGGVATPDIAVADLDGDGALDVLDADPGGEVSWWRNVGASFPLRERLSGPAGVHPSIGSGDLDGDGDLDLAVAGDDGVFLVENLGGAVFGPTVRLPAGSGCRAVAVVDVDGDGDQDVVASCSGATLWYVGTGGSALSGMNVVRTTGVDADMRFVVTDLDGDGDADYVAWAGGSLEYHENVAGTFVFRHQLSSDPYFGATAAADLDGDGLIDLFGGYSSLSWYQNLPCASQDTDGDGLSDTREGLELGTSPLDPDTDGGGVDDGQEVMDGTDPLDPRDDGGWTDTGGTTTPTADTGVGTTTPTGTPTTPTTTDPTTTSGMAEDGDGCGCDTGGGSMLWALPLLAFPVRRRRYRVTRTPKTHISSSELSPKRTGSESAEVS